MKWSTYYSAWVFAWFILFKLGIIPYSPYIIYLGIVGIVSLAIIFNIIYYLFIYKKKLKNVHNIIIFVLITIFVDILPLFFLKSNIDNNSIIFALLLGLIYCIFMKVNKINIYKHYREINFETISKYYKF